jgi:hypothetical protein
MNWNEILQRFGTAIAIAVLGAIGSFVLGRWWGYYRARRQWLSKDFSGRVIVSLNTFSEDRLKIRTLLERSLEEVFLNPVAVEKVRDAAGRTTREDPLLPIEKDDCWFLLNFVLNAVAEKFVEGLFRQDMGQPVQRATYALCLTCERVGEERIRKVRAMLVRQDVLAEFPYQDSMPKLEREWHADRIKTLRHAAELYKKEPDNFLTLEVCV